MKKKVIIAVLLLFIVIIAPNSIKHFTSIANSKILSQLEGTIYFTERVDGVLTLFKSDATLQNKTLIYSHKGKGKDSYGDYNDNIIEFFYDKTNKTFYFIAMNNGSWSQFTLKEGKSNPTLLEREVETKDFMMLKTNYIQKEYKNLTALSKKGSVWLSENGNEKIIKKFYGIYDSKFTGYNPIGFSPDGKYLVYYSTDNFTPIGTIIDGMIKDSVGEMYIMDLSTTKSTKYIDAHQIQWVIY